MRCPALELGTKICKILESLKGPNPETSSNYDKFSGFSGHYNVRDSIYS